MFLNMSRILYYVVILFGLSTLNHGQFITLWRYSACFYEFGGRCSSYCNNGERAAHPFYCFYGLAQCCIPSVKSCKRLGGTCRLTCGADSVLSDSSVTCYGRQFCCIHQSTPPTTSSVAERQGACGTLTSTKLPRIINGYVGRPCEWPWMASLRHTTRGTFCSGVLVDDDTVLTAAHCAINAPIQDIRVHLGDYNTSQFDYLETSYAVKNIYVIDGYRFETKGKNLAVIKLSSPVEFDQCKKPACLLDPNIPLKSNSKCYIAGYGKTQAGESSVLQAADVSILENNICEILVKFSSPDTLPSDVLCSNTLADNTDGCQGDDGGMLVCPDEGNRWALAGIISYYSCNRLPTMYTNIAKYTDWILQKL